MTPPAAIVGIGMMTPVGDCAAQTASSVRAGICRYRESSVYNRRFQPMTLALLPEDALPPLAAELETVTGLTSRQMRMLRLAGPALREALAGIDPKERPPLFLALPEALPEGPPVVTESFLDHLLLQAGGGFDRATSTIFTVGRAGGMHALQAALEALAKGAPSVLVGGVDTYLDLYLLGTLDLEGRVLAEGVMDGFCPGEGASFLLLRAAPPGSGVCLLHPPGLASESGHRYSSEPYKGEALSEAIRAALAALGGGKVRTVLASLNGENFGAKEWGVAVLRNKAGLEEAFRLEHPAECYGDTGAATGPLLLGIASIGLTKGWLVGPCLAWCSSEKDPRGAACVTLST